MEQESPSALVVRENATHLTAANFRSVKQAPLGENEHPTAVSLESAVPAFQLLSENQLKNQVQENKTYVSDSDLPPSW